MGTKFTLIELNLDGEAQFELGSLGATLPFGSSSESDEASESEFETDAEFESEFDDTEDDESSGKAIGAVIALLVLVAAGVAVKKFRGEDDEPELEEEEPDVIVN